MYVQQERSAEPVLIVETVHRGRVCVLQIVSEPDDTTVSQVEAEFDRAVASSRLVIVDLSRCSSLSRAGVALLERLQSRLPEDTELALVHGGGHVSETLAFSGLAERFECHAHLADALAAARVKREPSSWRRTRTPPEWVSRPGVRVVGGRPLYSADWC